LGCASKRALRQGSGSHPLISLGLALLFGLFAAGALDDGGGFLLGAGLGWLTGMLIAARKRIAKLEQSEHALLLELRAFRLEVEQRFSAGLTTAVAARRSEPPSAPPIAPVDARFAQDAVLAPAETEPALREPEPSAPEPANTASTPPAAPQRDDQPAPQVAESPWPELSAVPTPEASTHAPDPLDLLFARVSSLLFGGNTIVRAGVLVLLVGIALLLRWAAEHAVFPIELRMCAAALIAIALVGVGFSQREARPGFGQSLQGAGVAALYMVVFFAFRSYQLLPGGLAFGLLAAIALSSGLLAVLQDAVALIVIGQVGGFMAPVLASSGGGSHVALFSYYLLLNLLIFAVSWFRPWRALNLIGFAFTFGIGSTWGALSYRPELFASTEPFLIAFFLLYSLIPVLYALRSHEQRRGWVDASLVFGTPLAVLLLQYALVKDVPFGMAYSTLALSAFYVLLSRALYRHAPEALRALIETLLAVGVGFATLAVPYGFDNHDLTGATWALEGAGLYWVGVRQQRWLSRSAGAALQLLAAGALLYQRVDGHAADETYPLFNARFLASLFVCLGALFVARLAHARRKQLPTIEAVGLQALIALGLLFFWGGLVHEVDRHVAESWQPGTALFAVLASVLLLAWLGQRLAWLPSRYPGAIWILLLVPTLLVWEAGFEVHPLGRGGVLAMPVAFLSCWHYLRTFTREVPVSLKFLHCAFLWFLAAFSGLEALHLVHDFAALDESWSISALGCALALVLVLAVVASRGPRFPFAAAPATYVLTAGSGLVLVLFLFMLSVAFDLPGDSEPLAFVPLLNPLDLTQLSILVALVFWVMALPAYGDTGLTLKAVAVPALSVLAFVALNAGLARSVHQLAQVPFAFDRLWDSTPMQVTLSVSWSVLGLCGTVLGSKRALRVLWMVAATLLGVVVLKLFTVDLAQLSTIAKIGTFLGVGFLLVLVGYFAPVPPTRAKEEPSP
jgi:uncharacterized membrane protein